MLLTPTDVNQLTDASGLLGGSSSTLGALTDVSTTGATTGQVLKYDGTQWAPATDVSGGAANADTLDSQDGTYYLDWTNTTNKPTLFDGAYSSLTGTPTLYVNSDVDSHLNQSGPTSGHVLSWNGTDYAWIAQSGGGGGATYTAGSGLTLTGTTFSLTAGHFDGAYGSLTGAPIIPADVSDLTDTTNLLTHVTPFSGVYADLTSKPTLFDGAYGSLSGTPTIPADISDLTDTTNLLTGAVYTNASVNTHLNQSSATASQVLSWNGTDYAWISNTSSSSFDQTLNTTDSVIFASVTTDSLVTSTSGTPTIASASNIVLQPTGSVVVQSGGFRLSNLTTTARNTLAASNGEMIYNTTANRIQAYQNGAWINIDDGSSA